MRISLLLLIILFIFYFSFSPIKFSVTDFLAPMRAWVFKFCVRPDSGQVYCGKENQDAVMYFCLLFFHFSSFHLSLCSWEIMADAASARRLVPGWAQLCSQIKVVNMTTLYQCTGRLFRAPHGTTTSVVIYKQSEKRSFRNIATFQKLFTSTEDFHFFFFMIYFGITE